MTTTESKIIVVGAGVLGLSTALYLARGGYKDVTVIDRHDYAKNHYNPSKGCDSASADINKIFRTGYVRSQAAYQKLSIEARDLWLQWNDDIRETPQSKLPAPLTPYDKVFDVCGLYRLTDGASLAEKHRQLLDDMQASSHYIRERQFVKDNAEDEERLLDLCPEFHKKYHLFDRDLGHSLSGYFSATDGLLLADKACVYAHHLCSEAGVKFILGPDVGRMRTFVYDTEPSKRVTGVRTFDNQVHTADTVIIACGAWTAEALPDAHRTVEATGGTVMFIDIPEDRVDLRTKFSPENFPVRQYTFGSGDHAFEGSIFPLTQGRLKFGFRARNFTNYQDHPTEPGLRISVPRTKYSDTPIDTVPVHGLNLMKAVTQEAFPELAELGFSDSRLCWYTDSVDTNLVVDYVPTYADKSVFICSGACGHGFKYLPILGKYVKDILEGKETEYTDLWKWKTVQQGKSNNGLDEGELGPRNMSKVVMANREDFSFSPRPSTNGYQGTGQDGDLSVMIDQAKAIAT